jgi:NDP-sugar pyrophosphorylase family protein
MHGLVLAGGEGSRLAAEGVTTPKPLLEVAGQPLIVTLLRTLERLGCESLTCMVRADFAAVVQVLEASRFKPPFTLRTCSTPSSAHTLVEGLQAVPAGPVFCTMVDTVMRPRDWAATHAATADHLAGGADAVLVVTPFLHDESPLYVARDREGLARSLGSTPGGDTRVSGGVYGFNPAARQAARDALADGVQRMRGFLQRLIADGARVATVEVPQIIDLDRRSDWDLANTWMASLDG